jgi:hypothetical protein
MGSLKFARLLRILGFLREGGPISAFRAVPSTPHAVLLPAATLRQPTMHLSDYGSEDEEFESLRARQLPKLIRFKLVNVLGLGWGDPQ